MRRKALLADGCPFRQPLCDYFAATFEGRFQVLVQPAKGLQEIDCTSMGDSACVF